MKRKNIIITGGKGDIASTTQEYIMTHSDLYTVYAPDERVLDVTNESSVKSFFENIHSHILINCAGYLIK